MATNRKRISRSRISIELDETIKDYLLTGREQERGTPGQSLRCDRFFEGYRGKIKIAWLQYRAVLLTEWIEKHPCSRPFAFWRVEHPDRKESESEAAFLQRHGLLTAEERRHLQKHPELLEPKE